MPWSESDFDRHWESQMVDALGDVLLSEQKKLAIEIINKSAELVTNLIYERYDTEEERRAALGSVLGNTTNFIGMYMQQLYEFGKGKNEGPFIDVFKELLQR